MATISLKIYIVKSNNVKTMQVWGRTTVLGFILLSFKMINVEEIFTIRLCINNHMIIYDENCGVCHIVYIHIC